MSASRDKCSVEHRYYDNRGQSVVRQQAVVWTNNLPELKAGLLAPATVEELLTMQFTKRLQPGLFSEAGKKWLEQHKGCPVALLVGYALCPQREPHWQVTGGCLTKKFMQALADTARITLTSSIVIAKAFPESRHFL